jgi:predicted enzyme related to lactoylglutathione lyase
VATPIQVVIDCADPARLAEFWAAALGYVVDPEEAGPRLFFQMVPEPKTVKNRVHVDLNAAGTGTAPDVRAARVDAKVAELVALGATIQRRVEENGERWVVMQDPEGNEFCVQ